MTYIEEMAIEIHVDCVHDSPGNQYEILKATEKLINQIIADTKRACCDAAENALEYNKTMCDWCVDVMTACEVKAKEVKNGK